MLHAVVKVGFILELLLILGITSYQVLQLPKFFLVGDHPLVLGNGSHKRGVAFPQEDNNNRGVVFLW